MNREVEILLAGDVNLIGVADPSVPFARVAAELTAADLAFANLECCLYDPAPGADDDGYFAAAGLAGAALKHSGFGAVGTANNVNYTPQAICASLERLAELDIPSTGSGRNIQEARAPVVVDRGGCRIGILQRTAVYWPDEQEATEDRAGVAVIAAHTAYRYPPRTRRTGLPPANRPGMPPVIETLADAHSLALVEAELRALRSEVDVVVASFHWGLFGDVLGYMRDYAHMAVDAGADVVIGHGPHDHVLPIEVRGGRPIFYNLGALSFQFGPRGKTFHDWVGLLVRFRTDGIARAASFGFVRQERDLVVLRTSPTEERETLEILRKASAALGTELTVAGNEVSVRLS